MTPLWKDWNFDPYIVGIYVVLTLAYLVARRGRIDRRTVKFVAGGVLACVLLTSPIDTLGHTYLFSMYMIEHMILFFAVGGLLVVGLPPAFDDFVERSAFLRWLTNPWATVTIAALLLWGWHIPAAYEAALQDELMHALEDISYTFGGMLFWWPLLRPNEAKQITPGPALIYLAGAMVSFGLLGILITLAGHELYPSYEHPKDHLGILQYLREDLPFTQHFDQQLAGLEMWVGGGFVIIGTATVYLVKLLRDPSSKEGGEHAGG